MAERMTTTGPVGGTKLVLAALGVAIFAVICVNVYISRVRSEVKRETFEVFMLERSLEPGEKLAAADVKTVKVPNDFFESFRVLGSLNKRELDNYLAEGAKLQSVGVRSQLVTHALFIGAAGSGLDRRITQGMRWKTITANSRTVPPILQPEMRVDIEAPFAAGTKFNEVLPVMENVRIVAVGAVTASDEATPTRARVGGFQNVTIEVTPEQATAIATIEQAAAGPFELHLRNPGDDRPIKIPTGGINERVMEIVIGRGTARPPAPTPAPGNRRGQ